MCSSKESAIDVKRTGKQVFVVNVIVFTFTLQEEVLRLEQFCLLVSETDILTKNYFVHCILF
jgi:hypothetical protein